MSNMEAIRFAYGRALAEAGEKYPDMVALDADVSNSTCSVEFAKKYPGRFFNIGIAEANMVCMAAGLASMGFIPVVNTFSFLLCERALDQIRSSVAYNRLNVKFAANYGGLSDSYDGASHHSITDLGIIRSIPGMALVVISDAAQMRSAMPPILEYDGPVYFRICRAETPVVHKENESFEIGKGVTLADGSDITVLVTGILVSRALEARERLAAENISAKVIEIHTIKPIDEEIIVQSAKETGAALTCEEGNILVGLGAAAAQVLAREYPVKMDFVGLDDCYAESGEYGSLLDKYGMSVEIIIEKARRLVNSK